MDDLARVAPAFVEMAHRIVWCTVATADAAGRTRTRILHPYWEWDGANLVGWIATGATAVKRRHLAANAQLSCSYWTPSHDTCAADAASEWVTGDAERERIWNLFKHAPAPVGYDPAIIPAWKDGPRSEAFAALRLTPFRLRVFPGSVLLGQGGNVLQWHA